MGDIYSVFKIKWGWMGIVQGEGGLKKIILPHANSKEVEKTILRAFPDSLADDVSLKPLAKVFDSYFKGNKTSPNLSINVAGTTEFSKKVWRATQSIPWGEVKTYKWLSLCIKRPRSFRAIGNALGKNPFPVVVPCHRVVRSDGGLGGFSAPAGIHLKRKMLEMEGVRFDSKGKVLLG